MEMDQILTFRGNVNTGVGLLTDFPQVGSSYGELGFPFGSDANSYRMQAMYMWAELETLYETADLIKGLVRQI